MRKFFDIAYCGLFLTYQCATHCDYCLNRHHGVIQNNSGMLPAMCWVSFLNSLELPPDLPVTLQGGEPTSHPGFYTLVNEVRSDIKMDLLTNLSFSVDEFIANVPLWRFGRESPYASVRISYHHQFSDPEEITRKSLKLMNAGYRIGVYGIKVPDQQKLKAIEEFGRTCNNKGIDFRMKEFLGVWQGRCYGNFKYTGAVCGDTRKHCLCRTSELLLAPDGSIYRCHSELYQHRNPISSIFDGNCNGQILKKFRPCHHFGDCNPCDVKIKTDRYQHFGHTSVEICEIQSQPSFQKQA